MIKIKTIIVAAATTSLLALSACSNSGQEAAQVCVDPTTNMRIDDSMCRQASPYIWWYITPGYLIPAYGYPVQYGYAFPPRGYHTSPAPSAGGVINKRTSRQRTQTVRPAAAATQAPPPKKTSMWNRQKTQPTQSKPQPQTQSKPRWQTYKPPPASRPVQAKPPTYSKYR